MSKTLKISNWQIGMDNELFLVNKEGKYITAEGIVKGTKEEPFKFDPENDFFATSLDCTSLEYNIAPVTTAEQLWKNIEKCRNYVESILPNDLIISDFPAAYFDYDQLTSDVSRLFGCSASLTCYSDEEVKPEPSNDTLRVCGSHVHVSYDDANAETSKELIRAMDLFLGIPSIVIEPINDRRKVGYGCAGNYRLGKSYKGVEFRTLSSHFASNKTLTDWVFRNTSRAIDFVNKNKVKNIIKLEDTIQRVINNDDRETAKLICKDFKLELI